MTLRIISPTDILFEGEIESVTLPGVIGSFTVLRHHAPLISNLTAGKIHYNSGNNVQELTIEGGIVDVNNNVVSVCIY